MVGTYFLLLLIILERSCIRDIGLIIRVNDVH